MDKKEIQTKLEDIGHSLQYHQEEIAHHQLVIDGELEKAKKLEAQLAEKPKLQKGDYGTKDNCLRFVVVAIDGNKVTFLWEGNSDKNKWKTEWNLSDIDDHFVFLGNIFDDLKAITEDVEFNKEYEFSCDSGDGDSLKLLLCHDGEVHFRGGVFLKNMKPIILCLRRMEATMKRAEQEQHGKEAGK